MPPCWAWMTDIARFSKFFRSVAPREARRTVMRSVPVCVFSFWTKRATRLVALLGKPSRRAYFATQVGIYRSVGFSPFTLWAQAEPKRARFTTTHATDFADFIHYWAVLAVYPSLIVLIVFDWTILAVPLIWRSERVGQVLELAGRAYYALGYIISTTIEIQISGRALMARFCCRSIKYKTLGACLTHSICRDVAQLNLSGFTMFALFRLTDEEFSCTACRALCRRSVGADDISWGLGKTDVCVCCACVVRVRVCARVCVRVCECKNAHVAVVEGKTSRPLHSPELKFSGGTIRTIRVCGDKVSAFFTKLTLVRIRSRQILKPTRGTCSALGCRIRGKHSNGAPFALYATIVNRSSHVTNDFPVTSVCVLVIASQF